MITTYIDATVRVFGGVFATLIGFRLLGPNPGSNEKFDELHRKWLCHLKWLGPFIVVASLTGLLLFSRDSNSTSRYEESKQKQVLEIQDSVSSEGKLAGRDQIISSQDGFKVLVPQGYTSSKPSGTSFSMVAAYDAKGEATPVFSVAVLTLDDRLDRTVEKMKAILISRNPTYKFTETKQAKLGLVNGYRVFLTSEQNGIEIRGGAAFFASERKLFMLIYGTRIELYDKNDPIFERVISSFGPI